MSTKWAINTSKVSIRNLFTFYLKHSSSFSSLLRTNIYFCIIYYYIKKKTNINYNESYHIFFCYTLYNIIIYFIVITDFSQWILVIIIAVHRRDEKYFDCQLRSPFVRLQKSLYYIYFLITNVYLFIALNNISTQRNKLLYCCNR